MATTEETDIRRELAGQREQLTEAVAELRDEIGHAADTGKKVGAAVAAVGGLATVLKIVRRFRRGGD